MRDAITSFNSWMSEKLADVPHTFQAGTPLAFPCAVIIPRTVEPREKSRTGSAVLAAITFQADCWADGGDALAAREIAERIAQATLGDSDRRVAIPRYDWDFSGDVPTAGAVRDLMRVESAKLAEIQLDGVPDMRLWRVIVELTVAIST